MPINFLDLTNEQLKSFLILFFGEMHNKTERQVAEKGTIERVSVNGVANFVTFGYYDSIIVYQDGIWFKPEHGTPKKIISTEQAECIYDSVKLLRIKYGERLEKEMHPNC